MVIVIPESDHARNSQICLEPCRALARSLNFDCAKHGPANEWGWSHPALPEDETLYVSELDCLWAGLQALAQWEPMAEPADLLALAGRLGVKFENGSATGPF